MLRWKKTILVIVLIFVAGYFSVSYVFGAKDDSHPLKGQKAPNLTIKKIDGSETDLYSIAKGKKVIVIDFWATWCGPCRNALPAMEKLARKYDPNQVIFLGINVWDGKVEEIKKFLSEKDIKTVNIFLEKDEETQRLYSFNGIPAIFVLDGDMNVHKFYSGYSSGAESRIQKAIDKLIK